MDTICSLKRQYFLNRQEFASPANIVVNIELERAGYFQTSKIIITDNYNSKIVVGVDLETDEGYRNTEHILNTLIHALEDTRAGLHTLREEYVKLHNKELA